jgi:hypothetical protein
MAKTDWNFQPDRPVPQELAFAVPTGHEPIVDRFSAGNLEIAWNVAAPTYHTAQVEIRLRGHQVASHGFSPGRYEWAPAQIHHAGDALRLVMHFLPACPAANGELTIVALTLAHADGETLEIENVMLQGWDFVGAEV